MIIFFGHGSKGVLARRNRQYVALHIIWMKHKSIFVRKRETITSEMFWKYEWNMKNDPCFKLVMKFYLFSLTSIYCI